MNKLLTNEGGQPVYLDDLQLLQTTSWELMKGFVLSLAGTDSGFLLNEPVMSTSILPSANLDDRGYATIDGVNVTIGANYIVYMGNIIPFDSATFLTTDIDSYGGIRIGIRRLQSDNRTCADGQVRSCRELYTAFLYVGNNASVTASYKLYDLECLHEIIARRIGSEQPDTRWKQMPVVFYGGFSGSIRYTEGSKIRVKIHVRSSETSWAENDEDYGNDDSSQYKGLIGVILDSGLRNTFAGTVASDAQPYVQLRPDGTPFSQEMSWVKITSPRGKIVINNYGNYVDESGTTVHTEGRGYRPPCMEGDAYGECVALLDPEHEQ